MRRLLIILLFGLVLAGGAAVTWQAMGKARLVEEDLTTARTLLARAGGFGEFQFRLRRGDLHVPRTDLTEPLALELDHFLECCRTGVRPRTDGWNGVRVVATLEAAQQSLDKGGIQVEVDAASR